MFGLLRRVAVTKGCGRRIFGGLTKDLPEKGDGRGIQYGAWWSVMSRGRAGVAGAAGDVTRIESQREEDMKVERRIYRTKNGEVRETIAVRRDANSPIRVSFATPEEAAQVGRDLGLAIDPEIARIVEIWRATICQRMPEVEATALAARFRKTLHDLAALWGD